MDSLIEIIKGRRSVRQYDSAPLEEAKIRRLIEALRWAPSAGNLQARKFYLVTSGEVRKRLSEAAKQNFIDQAPLVVVGCADLERVATLYGARGRELYCLCDVSCSIQNLMLLAHKMELATVWIGAFDEDQVKDVLGLPEHLRPVVLVPVGYSAATPSPPPRRSVEEVVGWVS